MAAVTAVYLLHVVPRWAGVVAVVYQVAGAVLAMAQFVSLQNGLNLGWLTREILQWWNQRPGKSTTVSASMSVSCGLSAARGYASGSSPRTEPIDEQLRLIWQKLSQTDSILQKLGDDIKLQGDDFGKQLVAVRGEALGYSKDAEQRLSKSITSAPLQAAIGFWLILLGQVMQVWMARPP